jgi:hypothetical protein
MPEADEVHTASGDASTVVASVVVVIACLFPAYMADYHGWAYEDWLRIVTVTPATVAVAATFGPIKRLALSFFGRGNSYRREGGLSGQQALTDLSSDGGSGNEAKGRQEVVRLITHRINPPGDV